MTITDTKRVLMPGYSYIYDDPRIISEGAALAKLGYKVYAVGVRNREVTARVPVEGMEILLTPLLNTYHPYHLGCALWDLVRGDVTRARNPAVSQRSTVLAILFFNLWILRLALKIRPQIFHCQEHQGLLGTWLAAKCCRVPWIYDSHESLPDNRQNMGRKASAAVRIESWLLKRANGVITVGERLARKLKERGARRVVVVGNWKAQDDYLILPEEVSALRTRLELDSYKLVVSYIGALQAERDIPALLDAVTQTPDVCLLIGGRGPLEPLVVSAAERAPNIRWLGWIDLPKVPAYTVVSDAIYHCLNANSANNYYVMPNKLFESFMAGKPMIARRGSGEIGEILETIGSAVLLDEVTPETVKFAFEQLRDPVFRAQLAEHTTIGRARYNSDTARERLAALYGELISV